MATSSLLVATATARNLDLLAKHPGMAASEFGRRKHYSGFDTFPANRVAGGVLHGLLKRGLVYVLRSPKGTKLYFLTELGVSSLFNFTQEHWY